MSGDAGDLAAAAASLLSACEAAGLTIATAESCTGGLIAATLTEIPGSSAVFERGFVTYSNAAKVEVLGVPGALIQEHGAVSTEVAGAMAAGALSRSSADLALAVTGIAGPGGGTPEKPVGLVHLAAARGGRPVLLKEARYGDIGRTAIRLATVADALALLGRMLEQTGPHEMRRSRQET